MGDIAAALHRVRERIREAERRFGRAPGSVQLLAVSKTRPATDIREAVAAGQRLFGESYLQEALGKIQALDGEGLEWHYIGRIQSNKTRPIAEHFAWVHSLDSAKHARRLDAQRPPALPPLNVCLQVNIDREQSKGGLAPAQVQALAQEIRRLPRLRLRGLMTLPAPRDGLEAQRRPFHALGQLLQQLDDPGQPLDTLSMGMSGDLEAAIAEGATLVRVGTAIFGPRLPIT